MTRASKQEGHDFLWHNHRGKLTGLSGYYLILVSKKYCALLGQPWCPLSNFTCIYVKSFLLQGKSSLLWDVSMPWHGILGTHTTLHSLQRQAGCYQHQALHTGFFWKVCQSRPWNIAFLPAPIG